jgi:RNA-directed DNA polymerase
MEKVCAKENMNEAYKRVKANRGSAGIDGMTIEELGLWLKLNWKEMKEQLLEGSYKPSIIKGVKIPKPDGGERQLGIPTVKDRLVQQGILQILSPIWESDFSENSYGFRPRRSAHDALKAGAEYVKEGRVIAVDLDIEKFFDRVNHDMLMGKLAKKIADKRMLRLIRRFLEAGMMSEGVCVRRGEGTPQGGPLSPLMANILLDTLDKELEKRGHKFVRYADDCNIYVRTIKAGERVLTKVKRFLWEKLRLKCNEKKSHTGLTGEKKFLGYTISPYGTLSIARESKERFKKKVSEMTKRNKPESIESVVERLNKYMQGWVIYFRLGGKSIMKDLDRWVRRKIRCLKIKQLKRPFTIAKFLIKQEVPEWSAWLVAKSGKGWWRLSNTPQTNSAMSLKWFENLGLINLQKKLISMNT